MPSLLHYMCQDRPGVRRARGCDLPWQGHCSGTLFAALLLVAGYYALLAPCVCWRATTAVSVVHFIGIVLYVLLVGRDVATPPLPRGSNAAPSGAPLRWCEYCGGMVPAAQRTKHCHTCCKCVDGFDHHCVFLQTCVGARNYRHFLALVALLVGWTGILIGLDAALIGGVQGFPYDSCSSRASTPRTALLGLHAGLAAVCFLASLTLGVLHIYLHIHHQSTYDFILAWRRRGAEKAQHKAEKAQHKAQSTRNGFSAAGVVCVEVEPGVLPAIQPGVLPAIQPGVLPAIQPAARPEAPAPEASAELGVERP